MTTISDGTPAQWGEVALTARGLQADVTWGVSASARSGDSAVDPLSAQIDAADGLQLVAQAQVRRLALTGTGGRGGPPDGAVVVDLGHPVADERRVVLVQEGERFAWFIPDAGATNVELPVEAAPGSRSIVGDIVHRVVRVVAVKVGDLVGKAVEHATGTLVGAWDERTHPYEIRTWTPENYTAITAPTIDAGAFSKGPALLVIHGFLGAIHSTFASFAPDVVSDLNGAYEGRVFAFNHQTLAVSPIENVDWFLKHLPEDAKLEVDIMAHSRGGLVAREIARRPDPRISVRAITFVATPNDGTPLADPTRPEGLLDAVTNLIGTVTGNAPLEFALELLKDIVLKHALAGLRGLFAMEHDGPYLNELNHLTHDPKKKPVVLRSLSADFEPQTGTGIVTTARNKLTDLYFGGVRNDMVVPTLSTFLTDGVFHIPTERRLVLDSSRGVSHSTFWSDPRAVKQLRAWLRADAIEHPAPPVDPTESDPGAETALPPDRMSIAKVIEAAKDLPNEALHALQAAVGGQIDTNAIVPGTGERRDAVIVLPGIMGSRLRTVADKQLIWSDPLRLARGHFRDLAMDSGIEIEPAGLMPSYWPLVTRLSVHWDVYPVDYDWRADIAESAKRLAGMIRDWKLLDDRTRAIHFVAHSMGGLVCRALALDGVAPEIWADIHRSTRTGVNKTGSGRLVMLGTPNRGSFTIPLTLTGEEMTMKALALIDTRSTREDLVRVVSTFPGVYQMLPSFVGEPADDDHTSLFEAPSWGPGSPVQQELLVRAKEFHESLAKLDGHDRFVYVAGYGHQTPYRITIDAPGKFRIGRFSQGDKRVPWKLGVLPDVMTFYTNAVHGGLPADPAVLDAIDELLNAGTATHLLTSPPEYRGGTADADTPVMVPAAQWDPDPTIGLTRGGDVVVPDWRTASRVLDEALSVSVGGGVGVPSVPFLRVRVAHGSLEFAHHPVAVGHYTGLPARGAEAALDIHLDGALRERQTLGLYPDEAGDAMLVPGRAGSHVEAGVVLGLGNYGEVTEAVLTQAMKTAVLTLTVDGSRRPSGSRSTPAGISSVLIGVPGRHGLSLTNSIRAQVEGVARALIDVASTPSRVDVFELEFIECFEYRAENAVQVLQGLRDVLDPAVMSGVELKVDDRLDLRAGAYPGAPPFDESGDSWVRIQVELKLDDCAGDPDSEAAADRIRTVQFTPLTRGAQANRLEYEFDLDKVNHFVDAAIHRAGSGPDVTHALYEMLFPNRTKLDLDPSENLHLLVDETMAQLPWELLTARTRTGELTPLSLRAGILRQLMSRDQTRERGESPVGTRALVIGNPPTRYAPLPAARDEAEAVAERLRGHDWTVTSLIYDDAARERPDVWMEVLNALHADSYRIVHVAAHGVFDDVDPQHRRSGVIIGQDDYQRITALDFQQMSVTPDLVFLNCCHLGRLGTVFEGADPLPDALMKPHRVAGTVARQLLMNGVSAVVVAGWAVDDAAASAFAQQVYSCLLDGVPFGEAVREARLAARSADGGRSVTWGAYQCYGDPGFELSMDSDRAGRTTKPASSGQLARQLRTLATRAGDAIDRTHLDIASMVNQLRTDVEDLFDDPAALEALGQVYGELGDYEQATIAYRRALDHRVGTAQLKAAEQLVNLTVRFAIARARAAEAVRDGTPDKTARAINQLFDNAIKVLDQLVVLGTNTGEREAIRGSLHKKRATTDSGDRAADLRSARDAYAKACSIDSQNGTKLVPYHTNLWLQMIALTTRGGSLPSAHAGELARLLDQVTKDAAGSKDYWDVAAVADTLVTVAVTRYRGGEALVELLSRLGGTGLDRAADLLSPGAILGVAERQYVEAFRLNSTVRQRASSIDHLDDLVLLTKNKELKHALVELQKKLAEEHSRASSF
jgi:tetratricopeptide (TPR) repeat protein